jgi:NAD(P)-dependent dehydrogenase (short-subunit alcohol dehydrogenase family)
VSDKLRQFDAMKLACDATDRGQVEAAFAAVETQWGVPDLVVYNASFRTRGALAELDPDDVKRSIEVTAYGAFLVAQAAAKRMLAQGSGAIFFTGASASIKAMPTRRPLPWASSPCAGLRRAWRASLLPRESTSRIS